VHEIAVEEHLEHQLKAKNQVYRVELPKITFKILIYRAGKEFYCVSKDDLD
jgi:hypothetical protein